MEMGLMIEIRLVRAASRVAMPQELSMMEVTLRKSTRLKDSRILS